jgi:hypothetical protein
MTTCTLAPTVAVPRGSRILAAVGRIFSRSVVTREGIDQAWIDAGLGRLGRSTLEDIGAPPGLIADALERETWLRAAALDASRRL